MGPRKFCIEQLADEPDCEVVLKELGFGLSTINTSEADSPGTPSISSGGLIFSSVYL